jgi:hypothetical protein
MKRAVKCSLAIVLIVALAFSLSGCGMAREMKALNNKVVELVNLMALRDTDGTYAMLYPGSIEHDAYAAAAEQIYDYFPVTAGYTYKLTNFNVSKNLTGGGKVCDGTYTIEFGGNTYHLYVVWRSDKGGSGFTDYRVWNETDWNAAQGQ